MILNQLKTGSVLIAEPSIIGDVSFQRSVVLIANHSNTGSIGFIMNKPLGYRLGDVLPSVEGEFEIYNGGPVEQDNLYFIHKIPHLVPDSAEISDGIYWGGDFEIVAKLISEKIITPKDIKFFLGYSGWSTNQLHTEMDEHAWVVTEKNLCNMISDPTMSQWKHQMISLGGDYILWANAPENPSSN